MAKVLNDGSLACFEVGEAAGHLLNLSFDAILASLKSLQVFKHQIFDCMVDLFPSAQGHNISAKYQFNRLRLKAGRYLQNDSVSRRDIKQQH